MPGDEPGLTRGVRLGVDVGTVRIGVSRSDPDGLLAMPVTTLGRDRQPGTADTPRAADMLALAQLVREYEAVEVVVGLPVTLRGDESYAAREARRYATRLSELITPVAVTLVDERLSTVVATRRLSDQGVRGKRRRAVVDQAAAVEILQSWLDAHRRRTDAGRA